MQASVRSGLNKPFKVIDTRIAFILFPSPPLGALSHIERQPFTDPQDCHATKLSNYMIFNSNIIKPNDKDEI